jgi:hypothetical protein
MHREAAPLPPARPRAVRRAAQVRSPPMAAIRRLSPFRRLFPQRTARSRRSAATPRRPSHTLGRRLPMSLRNPAVMTMDVRPIPARIRAGISRTCPIGLTALRLGIETPGGSAQGAASFVLGAASFRLPPSGR